MSAEGTITIRILRAGGPNGEAVYRTYSLSGGRTTALAALQRLYEEQDPTLSFRNYRCNQKVCGSCFMRINGKVVRGCQAILTPGGEYVIEPVSSERRIKDLACSF